MNGKASQLRKEVEMLKHVTGTTRITERGKEIQRLLKLYHKALQHPEPEPDMVVTWVDDPHLAPFKDCIRRAAQRNREAFQREREESP